MNKKNLIILLIIVIVLIVSYFIFVSDTERIQEIQEIKDPSLDKIVNSEIESEEIKFEEISLLPEKEQILINLKKAAEAKNYQVFGQVLERVYENRWENEEEFESVESALYVDTFDTYFNKRNYEKALEVSTTVHKEAPFGWRFRYLRIRSLEALGRIAFDVSDLDKAEEYAWTILQMMYRIEGANLMADVYIRKIENSLSAGNKTQATKDLDYIEKFEISQDRKDKLELLKAQI